MSAKQQKSPEADPQDSSADQSPQPIPTFLSRRSHGGGIMSRRHEAEGLRWREGGHQEERQEQPQQQWPWPPGFDVATGNLVQHFYFRKVDSCDGKFHAQTRPHSCEWLCRRLRCNHPSRGESKSRPVLGDGHFAPIWGTSYHAPRRHCRRR